MVKSSKVSFLKLISHFDIAKIIIITISVVFVMHDWLDYIHAMSYIIKLV
jgi:peroxiredoxin